MIDPRDPGGQILTNATGGLFDQSDVGHTVYITGGAGFNVGISQVIQAVDVDGGGVGLLPWGASGAGQGSGVEYKSVSYTDSSRRPPVHRALAFAGIRS